MQPLLTTGYPLQHVLQQATQQLLTAGCDTPRLDAELLLAYTLKQERVWLLTHPDAQLSKHVTQTFSKLVERRTQREPLAYIVGKKAFYELDFTVTPQVLIPRPETEILVQTALGLINRPFLTVVDVGTGSGCIAVSIAHELTRRQVNTSLIATDVSTEALAVARQNVIEHNLTQYVTLVQSNLLDALPGPIDILLSNPPYIAHADLLSGALMPDVALYEPRLALDGGPDGLNIFRQLLNQAKTRLASDGIILLEIGFDQGPALSRLARTHFPNAQINICQDLAGLDRVVLIQC